MKQAEKDQYFNATISNYEEQLQHSKVSDEDVARLKIQNVELIAQLAEVTKDRDEKNQSVLELISLLESQKMQLQSRMQENEDLKVETAKGAQIIDEVSRALNSKTEEAKSAIEELEKTREQLSTLEEYTRDTATKMGGVEKVVEIKETQLKEMDQARSELVAEAKRKEDEFRVQINSQAETIAKDSALAEEMFTKHQGIVNQMQEEMQKKDAEFASLAAKLKSCENELQNGKTELSQVEKNADSRILSIQTELTNARTKIAELEHDLSDCKVKLDSVQSEFSTSQASLENARAKLLESAGMYETSIENVKKASVQEIESRIKECIEKAKREQADREAGYQGKLSECKRREEELVNKNASQMAELKEKLDSSENKIKKLEDELRLQRTGAEKLARDAENRLHEQANAHEIEKRGLNAQLNSTVTELLRCESQLEESKAVIRKEGEIHINEVKELIDAKTGLVAHLADLNAKMQHMNTQLEEQRADCIALSDEKELLYKEKSDALAQAESVYSRRIQELTKGHKEYIVVMQYMHRIEH